MGQEWNPLFPNCSLTQIKPEQYPCQPSSLRIEQDSPQTCIQTDPLEKTFICLLILPHPLQFSNHLSDSHYFMYLQPHTCSAISPPLRGAYLHTWNPLLVHLLLGLKHFSSEFHQLLYNTQPLGPSPSYQGVQRLGSLKPPRFKYVQKKNLAILEGSRRFEIFRGLSLSKSMCFISKSDTKIWD